MKFVQSLTELHIVLFLYDYLGKGMYANETKMPPVEKRVRREGIATSDFGI